MKVLVIHTGSKGNCYEIIDSNNNVLMIDCGVPFAHITENNIKNGISSSNIVACLISHEHSDHNKFEKEVQKHGIPTHYGKDLFEEGVVNKHSFGNFKVIPIRLRHSVECFGFVVIADGKAIFYASDTTALPNLSSAKIDLLMVECNYSQEALFERLNYADIDNKGYLDHLSLEYLDNWLTMSISKPKSILVIHKSNSGNANYDLVLETLSKNTKSALLAQNGGLYEIV